MKRLFALFPAAILSALPSFAPSRANEADGATSNGLKEDDELIAFFESLEGYNATMKLSDPLGEIGTAAFFGPKASYFHYASGMKLAESKYQDYGYIQRDDGIYSYGFHRGNVDILGMVSPVTEMDDVDEDGDPVHYSDLIYDMDYVIDPSEFLLGSMVCWNKLEDGSYVTNPKYGYPLSLACYILGMKDNYTDFDGLTASFNEGKDVLTIKTFSSGYASYSIEISSVGSTKNEAVSRYLETMPTIEAPTDWNKKTADFFDKYHLAADTPFPVGCISEKSSYSYTYDSVVGGVVQISEYGLGDVIDKGVAYLKNKGYALNESASRMEEIEERQSPRAICMERTLSVNSANNTKSVAQMWFTYNPTKWMSDTQKALHPNGTMVITIMEVTRKITDTGI